MDDQQEEEIPLASQQPSRRIPRQQPRPELIKKLEEVTAQTAPSPPPEPPIALPMATDEAEAEVTHIAARRGQLSDVITPTMTAEEVVGALLQTPDDKFLPWETCYLPSDGLYYGWADGAVKVRPMGTAAEKVLATDRLSQSGEAIDYLLRTCCSFQGNMDPIDMLLGDRTFLLYYIRGITHGNEYEFALPCPNPACQKTDTYLYDLNDLAATIKHAEPSLGKEPFKVLLPYVTEAAGRDIWVEVRFLRGIDGHNMLASRKRKLKAMAGTVRPGERVNPFRRKQEQAQARAEVDDTVTENLEMVIASVMGVNARHVVRDFVNKLHSTDSTAIREWLRDHTPGIDTTVTMECRNCGSEFTVEIPLKETFFRPKKQ